MKEMMSEEEGSMSGNSDVEKNHKRVREQTTSQEDIDSTAKRIKVEAETEDHDLEDEISDSADGLGRQKTKMLREPESEPEDNEDSLSDINENSDMSQNSISSSNNNNLDRRKNNIVTLEDDEDEGEDLIELSSRVLVPVKVEAKDPAIVENGRHATRRGSVATSSRANNRSVETNEDSSGGSTSENRRQDTVLQRFEKEISDLTTLLLLKEKEWNAVIKLVKLKEIFLAHLKRRKDVEEILQSTIPSDGGADYIQKLFKQIMKDTIQVGANEVRARNSIIETEKEVIELGKQISSSRVHNAAGKSIDTDALSGSDSSQVDSFFLASNALRCLVNRNKATLMSHSIPTSSTSTTPISPSKVIGEGRQGPIVEVKSLIADYRSKAKIDSSKSSTKRPLTPGAAPTFTPMNQSATISFTDVLTRLKKLSDKDKDSNCSIAASTSTPNNIKTATASKAKVKSGSGSAKSSVGTTLAKLLSSNNAGTGNRNEDDNSVFSTKSTSSNNLTNSDKTLSLANLLASAKSRDDPQKKKADQPVPLCQGCNANKAQFVCAGCANQWYCSRECQVAAWDEHSEVCSG